MIGSECPECGKRIPSSGGCVCGWKPAVPVVVMPVSDGKARCSRCNEAVPLNAFHEDTPVLADRGARLCASCWIPALKRRMNGETLDSRCTVPGCDLEVRDHVEHCRRIAASADWEVRYRTKREVGNRLHTQPVAPR